MSTMDDRLVAKMTIVANNKKNMTMTMMILIKILMMMTRKRVKMDEGGAQEPQSKLNN